MRVKDNILVIYEDGFIELFEDEIFPEFVESIMYLELFNLAKNTVGYIEEGFEFQGIRYDDGYGVWKAFIKNILHGTVYDVDIDQSIFE